MKRKPDLPPGAGCDFRGNSLGNDACATIFRTYDVNRSVRVIDDLDREFTNVTGPQFSKVESIGHEFDSAAR